MKVTRLDPERGVSDILSQLGDRVRNLETNPAGNIHIRDKITTGDDVETVFGQLPDGSNGLQEWINDVTPPNQPAPPTALEPALGGIILTWSGLDVMGEPQPRDYSHTEVEYSDNGVTWTVGAIITPTSPNTTIPGLDPEKTYSVRLRSFDMNKNASEYSMVVGGGKTVYLVDPTEMIEELREEHAATMDELEVSLADNIRNQETLRDTITNLREEKIPSVERTIEEAQKSIVSNKEALALIPGDIAAAKQAAIDAANSSAMEAIELAQMSGQSLITNGNMDGGQKGWTESSAVTFVAAAARGGSLGMRIEPTTSNIFPLNVEVQTSSDRTYYLEMWVKRTGTDTTTTASIGFVAQTKTTAGTSANVIIQGSVTDNVVLKTGDISTTTFTKVKAEWTVPADVNRVRFAPWFRQSTTNVYFVDDMIVVDITSSKDAFTKAIAAASTDAAAKVAAAETAMALVAQGFANKAKDDAISSSLNTAIEKANAAKADAIDASRLEAELLATAAKNAAVEVANEAQRTATKAVEDALAASNLAGTKGKVLVQATAPGAADRNANTLWIDSSGTPAGNIPKKWVSGTTWTAVTDKTAVDAAAAAAKAIADAEAASRKATTAEETAGNAMQAAGSKTKVHYSTANPSGIGAVGDTWRKTDSNGNIIGEWRYTGGNPAWTAQLVTSTMLSNVDIGKLTVGTTVMQTGVADEFFAKIFSTNKLYAENVIIGEAGNSHPDPFFKDTEGWKPFTILPTGGRNGNPALEIPASTSQSGHYYGSNDRGRQFPVVEKSSYRVTVWVKADAATPANGVSIYAKWTNPTTVVSGVFCTPSNFSAPALVANVWTPITGIFDFPAGATKGFIGLFTQTSTNVRVLFSEPTVVRMIDDALVVEGGIKARSIDASEEMSAKLGSFLKVNTDMLVAGSASISTGVADKFFADIFATRKLSASNVFIGQGGNLVPNGYGELGDGSNWPGMGVNTSDAAVKALGAEASFWLEGTRNATNSEWFTLRPGAQYKFSVHVKANTTGKRFYVQLITNSEAPNQYMVSNQLSYTTFREYKNTYTAPEGATKGRFMIYANHANGTTTAGHQWFTAFDFRELVTPSLIIDGLMDAQRIIGAIIETSGAANEGIKLNSTGLVAYNNSGAETLRFDGANSIITGATFRTAASGARVQLSTTGLEAWNSKNERYLAATGSGLDLMGTIVASGDTSDTIGTVATVHTSRAIVGRRNAEPGIDLSPGFWLEVEANGVKLPNSVYPAGLRSTSPYTADGAVLQSARLNVNSPYSNVSVGTGGVNLQSRFPYTNGYAAGGDLYLSREGEFSLNGKDGYPNSGDTFAIYGASRRNGTGIGELTVYGRDFVKIESPEVYINGERAGAIQHAEWTSTMTLVSSANSTPVNLLTADTTRTQNNSFAVLATNRSTITLKRGLYAVSIRTDGGSSLGDTARIAITNPGQTVTYLNQGIIAKEWDGQLTHPNLYAPANGFQICFPIRQTSGGNRTMKTTIMITKIA